MALPLAVLYRNLAQLHQAGVAWPEALDSAAGKDAPRFATVRAALARGESVSRAFEGVVPPLDLAGLRAAEASGQFSDLLRSLADRGDEEAKRTRAQRAALAYPVFLAHVAAFLLPIPDIAVGKTGSGLLWVVWVLGPFYLFLALSRAARRAAERDPAAGDALWARLVRTKASVEDADARALTALAWLHDAGVPPLESVPLAARAGAGGRVAGDLADALDDVRAGRAVTHSWHRAPEAIRLACSTGEASGALSEACERAAAELTDVAAYRRKRFVAVAPVMLMLAIGSVIAYRVLSFYSHMFSAFDRLK